MNDPITNVYISDSLAETLLEKRDDLTQEQKQQLSDLYDFDASAQAVAESRGLVVVFPKENELQIDIDSPEQLAEFFRRLNYLCDSPLFNYNSHKLTTSNSGKGHHHVTIVCDRTFTEVERMMLQAALNDDPLRVFLNARRWLYGIENPSRLFEKP